MGKKKHYRCLAVTSVVPILLAGCSLLRGPLNERYDYEKPSINTQHGFFNITLNPEPNSGTADRRESIVWSNPYYFNTQYITLSEPVLWGEIYDVDVKSAKTGKSILHVESVLNAKQIEKLKRVSLLGFGSEIDAHIPYDDYRISFGYRIYTDESTLHDQGQISTLLKRRYYKTRFGGI